jgi:prophage maintenance system killer protein
MPYVNSHDNSVVEKASIIMGIIALKQPFFDGNRRTGLVAGIKFLHDNGYRLKINQKEQDELIEMLSKSKKKYNALDPEVLKQVSFYISKRIEPI